jgi:KDO2-lipid IV(A) lauroyltransferase
MKNAAIALFVRLALGALVPLPPSLLRGLGRGLGLLALAIFPAARRTAVANLARAFPETPAAARRALLLRAYVTLGAFLGDAIASLDTRRALAPLPIDDADLATLSDPRGVVFVSAHLGPWDRVAATLVARGVPLTAVAREPYDARLAWIYGRLREARGVRVVYRGAPGAHARIVRVLKGARVLGVPMDLRSRVPSVDAPFLGELAPTPVGPARIALRTKARVVVGTVARDLRVTCTPIATDDLACDARSERELTARINAELSRRIRAFPEAWVWMHERFAPAPTSTAMRPTRDPVVSSG